MITVPADGPGDMQGNLRVKAQKRRDFIGYHLCGMIVTVIHQRQTSFVGSRKAQSKLCASCRKCLHPNTEHLGFHTGLYLTSVKGLGKNCLNRLLIPHPGPHSVSRHILISVSRPDIHDAGNPCLFCKILGDADACPAVIDPEFPDSLIGTAQSKAVLHLIMREKGRIEVDSHVSLLCKLHPLLKMSGLQLIPVHKFAFLKNSIAGMEIQLFPAGHQAQRLIHILHQFFRRSCLSRIVSGCLDSAG